MTYNLSIEKIGVDCNALSAWLSVSNLHGFVTANRSDARW